MLFSEITDSTALVRVDLNLPDLQSLDKVTCIVPTIRGLLNRNNKVVLYTHWGRPKNMEEEFSTKNMVETLKRSLAQHDITNPIEYINQSEDFENALELIQKSKSSIVLLENVRFLKDETTKDETKAYSLAAKYAKLADVFVDDAFGTSHRKQVSNYYMKDMLPWCYGLSHQQEMMALMTLKNNPKSPYIFIMGGAKLETKLDLAKKSLKKADKLIFGGLLVFTFLQAAKGLGLDEYKDVDIKNSKVEWDFVNEAKRLLKKYPEKIILPIDFVYDSDKKLGEYAADIGPQTLEKYKENIRGAKTIFWNGPLGRYEKVPFGQGTAKLARFIANLEDVYTVLGGGDVVAAVPHDVSKQFSFVSMGGGASLEFLN